jgi:rare lipoprotein A
MLPVTAKTHYLILLASLSLQACSSSPASSRYTLQQDHGPQKIVDVSHVKNAVPKKEEKSEYGNPKKYKVLGKWYSVRDSSKGFAETGIASWYGKKFHGHRTSNGETYDMFAMTAAHKTLPLPTYVRVTHIENGRSIIVKVNDRGPFHDDRIIDLSYSAAKKLGVTATGTSEVKIVAIDPEEFQQNQTYQPKLKRPSALVTKDQVLAKSKLYLQAGAFSNKQNATQLQKRLIALFTTQQIHSEFLPENNIYRIRIGPLASIADADKMSTLLMDKGILTKKITLE